MKKIIKNYEDKLNDINDALYIVNKRIIDIIINNLKTIKSEINISQEGVVSFTPILKAASLLKLQDDKDRLLIKEKLFSDFIEKLEGCGHLTETTWASEVLNKAALQQVEM